MAASDWFRVLPLAIKDMDASFFGAINLLVDLYDEREMRGKDVPLDVPICSQEVDREKRVSWKRTCVDVNYDAI